MARKASLQLSINAIVIVVLAFVLLGLGLGFIRSQFKDIGSTTQQVQEQVKQQILEDLRTGDKKLSFPTQRVQLEKNEGKDLAIGVKNTLPQGELKFYINSFVAQEKETGLECDQDYNIGDSYSGIATDCPDGEIETLEFFYDEGPYTLSVASAEVYPISIEDAKGESSTSLVKVRIYSVDDSDNIQSVYAEKSFFVQVT